MMSSTSTKLTTPSKSTPSTLTLTPTSLSHVLARVKNVKGIPPSSVSSCFGLVCLNPTQLIRLNANVLDIVVLKTKPENIQTLSYVWPLYCIDDQSIALNKLCISSLGMDSSTLISYQLQTSAAAPKSPGLQKKMPVTSPTQSQRRRQKQQRRRQRQSQGETNANANQHLQVDQHRQDKLNEENDDSLTQQTHLEVSLLKHKCSIDSIQHAQLVSLKFPSSSSSSSKIDSDLIYSQVFLNHVQMKLKHQVVIPGMHVNISMLGFYTDLVVSHTSTDENEHEDDEKVRRVTEQTEIRICTNEEYAKRTKEKKVPLLDKLGGVGEALTTLKPILTTGLKRVENEYENDGNISSNNSNNVKHYLNKSIPRGILLYGYAGTGKTSLAIALAQWCNVHTEVIPCPSLTVVSPNSESSGSAKNIKKLQNVFSRARHKSPSIIVLDEIDCIGLSRSSNKQDYESATSDMTNIKMCTVLLSLIDDVRPFPVMVIGTTSKRESLDSALRRIGRLDVEIEMSIPTNSQRIEIIEKLVGVSNENNNGNTQCKVQISKDDIVHISQMYGHGFVQADIVSAWKLCIHHSITSRGSENFDNGKDGERTILCKDLEYGMKNTKPSALKEILIEIARTRWEDIGGKEDAKQRLKEAIHWPILTWESENEKMVEKAGESNEDEDDEKAKERRKMRSVLQMMKKVNIKPPKGILLYGPPGCSKTLLARAVATECQANFISIKGSELLSKYVGDSEKSIQKLFQRAKLTRPCIIFFDEIDALVSKRSNMISSNNVHARVVAQLLHEMDGIDNNNGHGSEGIIIIAATNRPDCLDEAFLRPGRIDLQIFIDLPDQAERLQILKVHTKCIPLAVDVKLDELSLDTFTGGFSGAELAALAKEAGICAMERDIENVESINRDDFERARLKVTPRTSLEMMQYFKSYVEKLERKNPCIR